MFEVFKAYLSDKMNLSESELARIQSLSRLKTFRKCSEILKAGEVWQLKAFVCKGCARMYSMDEDGTEHSIRFSVENWWVGDRESYTTGEPSKTTIEALEDTCLLVWDKADFESLMQDIPEFGSLGSRLLARGLNADQNRICASVCYNSDEKYDYFLKTYPDMATRVPLHMIASYLGLPPATLNRVRQRFSLK